jgi:hypothetical protein
MVDPSGGGHEVIQIKLSRVSSLIEQGAHRRSPRGSAGHRLRTTRMRFELASPTTGQQRNRDHPEQ